MLLNIEFNFLIIVFNNQKTKLQSDNSFGVFLPIIYVGHHFIFHFKIKNFNFESILAN